MVSGKNKKCPLLFWLKGWLTFRGPVHDSHCLVLGHVRVFEIEMEGLGYGIACCAADMPAYWPNSWQLFVYCVTINQRKGGGVSLV